MKIKHKNLEREKLEEIKTEKPDDYDDEGQEVND